MRPRLLRPDNFTPPARTPWGGHLIAGRYKRNLDLGELAGAAVGESWEISVEPSFPSRFADDQTSLADAICVDPDLWLGPEVAARYHGQTPLLVKLLDAADTLSIQVHPAAADPELGPDESGKPEGWYILEAAPGAGLYLGFAPGVERHHVAACLRRGERLDALMNFVPVTTGDTFVIHAGTPHAIGAGITLVEPQFIMPGRRGVTYRYWDWNRLYDARGNPSPDGTPRPLHVERSLAVTAWDAPRGQAAVDLCRARPRVLTPGSLARVALAEWPYFVLERWAGTGALHVQAPGTMLAVVCVAGAADVATARAALQPIRCGQSMVVPAAAGALDIHSPAGVDLLVTRSSL